MFLLGTSHEKVYGLTPEKNYEYQKELSHKHPILFEPQGTFKKYIFLFYYNANMIQIIGV